MLWTCLIKCAAVIYCGKKPSEDSHENEAYSWEAQLCNYTFSLKDFNFGQKGNRYCVASFIKCVLDAVNDYERKNIWRFIRGNTPWSSPTIQPCITLWFSEGQKQLWMRSWKEMKVVLGKFYQPIAVAASGVLCKQLLSKNIAPFKVVTSALVLHFTLSEEKVQPCHTKPYLV